MTVLAFRPRRPMRAWLAVTFLGLLGLVAVLALVLASVASGEERSPAALAIHSDAVRVSDVAAFKVETLAPFDDEAVAELARTELAWGSAWRFVAGAARPAEKAPAIVVQPVEDLGPADELTEAVHLAAAQANLATCQQEALLHLDADALCKRRERELALAYQRAELDRVMVALHEPHLRTTVARSPSTVRAFRRTNPCPATGKTSGACPGFVVDHRIPLCAGGPDDPRNMAWSTVADAKWKDGVERALCARLARCPP